MNTIMRNIRENEPENTDVRNQNQLLNAALENMIRFSETLNRLTMLFSEKRRDGHGENKSADPRGENHGERFSGGTPADTRQRNHADFQGRTASDSGETEIMARKIQRGADLAERVLRETEKIQKSLNRIQKNSDSDNRFYE